MFHDSQGKALVLSRDDPWVYAHNEGCVDFECYFESWGNCSAAELEEAGIYIQ